MSYDQPFKNDLLQGTDLAVASTAVVYSTVFKMPMEAVAKFSLEWLNTSTAGTVDLKIEIEQGNVEPATAGAASTDYVIPTGISAIVANSTAETVQMIAFAPVVSKFARFKITGQGSNNADTVISRLIVMIAK